MRILYINWAPLWLGAEVGGGVNVYQQSMAVALAAQGHPVFSVSSGYAYNLSGGIYLRRGTDYKGVVNYEIINAPNISPGYLQHPTPLAELSEPQVEEVFRRLLRELQPEVVHFNNIEGFSADCFQIARDFGAKVIFSLHNYHPVCNQVYLLYQDQEICLDFKDGSRCLDCVKPPSKRAEIRKRQVSFHFHQFPEGHLLWGPLQFFRNSAKIALLSIKTLRSVWRSFRERRAALNSPLPLHPAPSAAQLETQTAQQLQAAGLPYKQRRERMIAAINQSHTVLAVSSWVAHVYQGMGVDAAKLQVMHIGSRIAEAARLQTLPPPTPRQPGTPIRLVFLGLASPPKGLPFLLQAMLDMDNATLGQIRFSIYARGIHQLNHLLDPLSKRLDLLTVQDGYRYQDLPKLLADKDIGIVPPIWWDNAPQVVFEMLAFHIPVIGAKIGGIPDFVRHDENGLLFEPGNAADVTAQLSRAVLEVDLIARLRKGITPMKTIAEHAQELERLYQGL